MKEYVLIFVMILILFWSLGMFCVRQEMVAGIVRIHTDLTGQPQSLPYMIQ